MPGRFEKLTRAGTPRRALPSIGDRGPNGRRRIGCRVRPLRPARQARCPCAAPSPKAIRQTHRSLGALRPDGPSRAVGSLPADAATDPARPCGRASARRAAELVQRSQPDSLRRSSATSLARLPTGDSGQPGPSSIPCRHTHRFNVVAQPGLTPREPRQQSSPRHPGVLLIDNLNNLSPAGLALRGGPACGSPTRRGAAGVSLHAEAGRLAEPRGDRVERSRASVPGSAHARPQDAARRSRSLARRSKPNRCRCQPALQDRRRSHPPHVNLSGDTTETWY